MNELDPIPLPDHPILETVVKCAQPDGGQAIRFDVAGLVAVENELSQLKAGELVRASMALLAFAGYLDQDRGSNKGARQLVQVVAMVRDAVMAEAAKLEAANDDVEAHKARTAQLIGKPRKVRAIEGPTRQRGSVKVKQLMPRRRIIEGR